MNLRHVIRKLIKEVSHSQHRWLYHGTHTKAAEEIQLSGFDSSLVGKKSGDQENPGISFSIHDDIAVDHALWAAFKTGDIEEGAIVVVDAKNLKILNGTAFNKMWNDSGSRTMLPAVNRAKAEGYDAVELFDLETGDGIEEMEVLIINLPSIKISHINYVNPDDYPEKKEEYE